MSSYYTTRKKKEDSFKSELISHLYTGKHFIPVSNPTVYRKLTDRVLKSIIANLELTTSFSVNGYDPETSNSNLLKSHIVSVIISEDTSPYNQICFDIKYKNDFDEFMEFLKSMALKPKFDSLK